MLKEYALFEFSLWILSNFEAFVRWLDSTSLILISVQYGMYISCLTSLLLREGVLRLEEEPDRLGGRSAPGLPLLSPPLPFSRISPGAFDPPNAGCSPLGCGDWDASCNKIVFKKHIFRLRKSHLKSQDTACIKGIH